MNILHIDSSASAHDASHSRRLSAEIVERLKAANPDADVTYRDVAEARPPHVDTTIREAWSEDAGAHLKDLAERSRVMVEELKAADVVVIGSPMYNFTVPSTLKAWIDHVAIANQTFRYTANGPEGLLDGRAYLALSSGGVYSEGPAASADHLDTYLRTVLGFMGITEVETVRAEGTALAPDAGQKAMERAHLRIDALFA
ncbi:FMN-dependent NADH-azoreductase [Hasllibacter halocynthiae]|uniref:FMN dependent NADH:quinone oxidoreductase n=1 Tax=Hasllibacter halocynthiae TaxID=595589 RepID=A0A2T0X1L0_9RHOB|nr:FMN-dependent NADH-azoreductase [Hasllibacter halocynthiae]PRY92820.1 FMN-dependent NADH-azoreductase [Hasllibacter halocynthiae]